jgi:hypothetical protein
MARWREPDGGPVIPDWIRHEFDGGFVASAWAEPDDFALEPRAAESRARGRWIAARVAWLNDNPDVAEVLMEQLRDMARRC